MGKVKFTRHTSSIRGVRIENILNFNLTYTTRAAVVHLNFRAGSTFPVPVCTVPSSMDRTILCNKVDAARLHALYRMNLLLLKGKICVTIHFSLQRALSPVPWVLQTSLCISPVSLSCILYLTVYPVSCIQSSVLLLYPGPQPGFDQGGCNLMCCRRKIFLGGF